MQNRIFLTSKYEQLLPEIEPQPKSIEKQSRQNSSRKINDEILQSIKQRLDSDATKNPFIQRKIGQLAQKIVHLQQSHYPRSRGSLSDIEQLDRIQYSILKREETRLEKVYRKHRNYEQINQTQKQFRILCMETKRAENESKYIEPIEKIYIDKQPSVMRRKQYHSFWEKSRNSLLNNGKQIDNHNDQLQHLVKKINN